MKHLLQHAQDEIRTLRRANEVLGAQVEAMEFMKALYYAQPHRSGGMAPDIDWELGRAIEEIDEREKAEAEKNSPQPSKHPPRS